MRIILLAAFLLLQPTGAVAQIGIPAIDKVIQEAERSTGVRLPANALDPLLSRAVGDMLNDQPISTSFRDAEVPNTFRPDYQPDDFRRLSSAAIDPAGRFRLERGQAYEGTFESYCLKPGAYGPSAGDGYMPAAIRGSKAEVVRTILQQAFHHPQTPQQDIQRLLWAIIAKTEFDSMPDALRRTASTLLPAHLLQELRGGPLAALPANLRSQFDRELDRRIATSAAPLRRVLEAERRLRSQIASGAAFQALEQTAVLLDLAPPKSELERGTWAWRPAGYFIRYLPSGYSNTTVQVLVPADADSSATLDLTAELAVPANTSSQRLGVSGRESNPPECPSSSVRVARSETARFWKDLADRNWLSREYANGAPDNQAITCAYVGLYRGDPERFKWAGLAAIVSRDVGQTCDSTSGGYCSSILEGNQAVFDDLAWQHLLFKNEGLEGIERAAGEGALCEAHVEGWRSVESGDPWSGNLSLLRHEQAEILQPLMYDGAFQRNVKWRAAELLGQLKSPIPGHDSRFDGENFAVLEQRWRWISAAVWPAWRSFEDDPANAPALEQELERACPLAP